MSSPCIDHLLWSPSPLTSSLTLLVAFSATLDTEQVYTPASLNARLLISSCDLPVLLVTLLPSPRINKLPSFSQRISGAGMPVKEHTSSKWSPSVWVSGTGKSIIVGRAVGERDIHIDHCSVWAADKEEILWHSTYCSIQVSLVDFGWADCSPS